MTATLLDNDIEVFEVEDFETVCDVTFPNGKDCEHPARWTIFKRCCGNVSLWCDECKEIYLSGRGAMECRHCGEITDPVKDVILYMEPLSKS